MFLHYLPWSYAPVVKPDSYIWVALNIEGTLKSKQGSYHLPYRKLLFGWLSFSIGSQKILPFSNGRIISILVKPTFCLVVSYFLNCKIGMGQNWVSLKSMVNTKDNQFWGNDYLMVTDTNYWGYTFQYRSNEGWLSLKLVNTKNWSL